MDKLCSKCGLVKSADSFSKNRNVKDGLDIICKDCKRAYQKERRLKLKPVSITEKLCSKCGVVKPVGDFYRDLNSVDGYQCYCISCHKEYKYEVEHISIQEKRCNKCGQIKPASEFYENKSCKDGHIGYCVDCYKLYYNQLSKRPKLNITEKKCHKCHEIKPISDFAKDKYTLDGCDILCRICEKKFKRNEHYIKHVKEYERNLKAEVLTHYSPNGILQCSDPFHRHKVPETDIDVLSLDHINGGGAKEKRENTRRLYYRVKQANYPQGYQTLCFSCQMKKKLIQKEQPTTRLKNPEDCDPDYEKNRINIRSSIKKYMIKAKVEALKHYSINNIIKCADPYNKHSEPETDIDILCIDHINGNGHEDKKNNHNTNLYLALRRDNYPSGLQVLCANCNNKKRIINKENGDRNKKGK